MFPGPKSFADHKSWRTTLVDELLGARLGSLEITLVLPFSTFSEVPDEHPGRFFHRVLRFSFTTVVELNKST